MFIEGSLECGIYFKFPFEKYAYKLSLGGNVCDVYGFALLMVLHKVVILQL